MTDLEVIERATALMRERATAATPGPWFADVLGSEGYAVREDPPIDEQTRPRRLVRVARCGHEDWDTDKANAEYLASVVPSFALAVADWLEGVAAKTQSKIAHGGSPTAVWANEVHAVLVARAYLAASWR